MVGVLKWVRVGMIEKVVVEGKGEERRRRQRQKRGFMIDC